jgi:hypothetical protein
VAGLGATCAFVLIDFAVYAFCGCEKVLFD